MTWRQATHQIWIWYYLFWTLNTAKTMFVLLCNTFDFSFSCLFGQINDNKTLSSNNAVSYSSKQRCSAIVLYTGKAVIFFCGHAYFTEQADRGAPSRLRVNAFNKRGDSSVNRNIVWNVRSSNTAAVLPGPVATQRHDPNAPSWNSKEEWQRLYMTGEIMLKLRCFRQEERGEKSCSFWQ